MTFYPLFDLQDAQDAQDAQEGISTAYDSTWATAQIPEQGPLGTEQYMLAQDKLYVVLGVVLIIWLGIAYFIHRTDRRLVALEKAAAERTHSERIPEEG